MNTLPHFVFGCFLPLNSIRKPRSPPTPKHQRTASSIFQQGPLTPDGDDDETGRGLHNKEL
eukprot:scaffold138624_cov16-Tisochrysis_lutea.AAC.2